MVVLQNLISEIFFKALLARDQHTSEENRLLWQNYIGLSCIVRPRFLLESDRLK